MSIIATELGRAMPGPVVALAASLAARAAGGAAAVLFYGSALRDGALDGVLDFYVLLDRPADWPGSRLAAFGNTLLPPNVGYLEAEIQGRPLRAKYAVMSLAQFGRAMSARRVDTTLWARFSQPCACVHARGDVERSLATNAVADAVVAAAHWAAVLGPEHGAPSAYWRSLYARTYDAELRVERTGRAADLVGVDEARYARLLPLAWRAGSVAFVTEADGVLSPSIGPSERRAAERRWRLRRRLGRPLNLLRLLKAAATFDNAIDYVAWKIERHSGHRIEPSDFQRRHPLLAAPALYWRLRGLKVLR